MILGVHNALMINPLRALTFVTLLVLPFASAQGDQRDVVAGVLANHLDAIIAPCPEPLDEIAACYQYVGAVDIHKMALDVYASMTTGFDWVIPWHVAEDGALMRAFSVRIDGESVMYFVALRPAGGGSLAFVIHSDSL